MTILQVDPGVLLYGIRVNVPDHWAAIFFGTFAIVVWGKGEGKSQLEARYAKIRSEARQRCIDEIVAFSRGEKIDKGIGADVTRAYYMAQLAAENRRSYREWE